MVSGVRVLSPQHVTRSEICSTSPRARRQIAKRKTDGRERIRCGLFRHPLEEISIEYLHQSSNLFVAQCDGTHVATIDMPMLDGDGQTDDEND